jgi:aspartyl-tRNA(Asn)/glutamyl-tRNA(Gln) amidotransferase subunit A
LDKAMNPLVQMSAYAMADAIREGRISSTTLMEAVLSQVANATPHTNAFALVAADVALKAAHEADAVQQRGDPLGSLHGVPFSVKDLIDTQGIETAFGSWLMEGNVPSTDAEVVRRLKVAGAVLMGKTTTPEFAGSVLTSSPRYGVTRNPWNLDYSAGGSSGGAAAAVATGCAPLGLATDGAGSARIPASCCGLLGLKPTLGRVPHERAPDLFSNFSHIGLITRRSVDLALMLTAVAGPFSGDPWTAGGVPTQFAVPSGEALGLKGQTAVFLPRMGNKLVANDVLGVCRTALDALRARGLEIVQIDEELDWGIQLSRTVMRSAMSARMARFNEEERARMDPALLTSIREGDAVSVGDLKAAPFARTALYSQVEKLLKSSHYILTPTVSAAPPRAEVDATASFQIDGEDAGDLRSGWFTYPTPFNLTGHPAISIPAGVGTAKLPIGLQAVGRWGAEQSLITLAAMLELDLPWTDRWPQLPGAC